MVPNNSLNLSCCSLINYCLSVNKLAKNVFIYHKKDFVSEPAHFPFQLVLGVNFQRLIWHPFLYHNLKSNIVHKLVFGDFSATIEIGLQNFLETSNDLHSCPIGPLSSINIQNASLSAFGKYWTLLPSYCMRLRQGNFRVSIQTQKLCSNRFAKVKNLVLRFRLLENREQCLVQTSSPHPSCRCLHYKLEIASTTVQQFNWSHVMNEPNTIILLACHSTSLEMQKQQFKTVRTNFELKILWHREAS